MSADNWALCPRCLKTAKAERAKKVEAVAYAYGKVPAPEFAKMQAEVAALEEFGATDEDHTLSEYYELGVLEDGTFYVRYSGECRTCGFAHKFQHDEQLTVGATT